MSARRLKTGTVIHRLNGGGGVAVCGVREFSKPPGDHAFQMGKKGVNCPDCNTRKPKPVYFTPALHYKT